MPFDLAISSFFVAVLLRLAYQTLRRLQGLFFDLRLRTITPRNTGSGKGKGKTLLVEARAMGDTLL
jgi:hypothetical protein